MGLFILNESTKLPDIAPETRAIAEFRKIITKDKDRFKKLALKELFYIYHIADYSSPYKIYQKEEREKKVKRDVGLEDSWKPDKWVLEAIDKYVELSDTPTLKAVKAVQESLLTASKVINAVQKQIERALKDEEGDIDDMIDKIEKLLKISDNLPKSIDGLKSLEEKARAEQEGDNRLKGGGKINPFEV